MKGRKKVILGAVLALFFVLAAYRLWPRSFGSIFGAELEGVTEAACSLDVISDYTPGKPGQEVYRLKTADPAVLEELTGILESSKYRSDLRNLWPWWQWTVSSGRNYDGRSLYVVLYFGDREEPATLSLLDRDIGHTWKGRTVHPTDKGVFDRLAGFIQEKGERRPVGNAMVWVLMDGAGALLELAGMVV